MSVLLSPSHLTLIDFFTQLQLPIHAHQPLNFLIVTILFNFTESTIRLGFALIQNVFTAACMHKGSVGVFKFN